MTGELQFQVSNSIHFFKFNNYLHFFVFLILSLIFTKYYFLLTNEYYPASYARNIADFEADKVFQKRFLIPVTADILSQFTPLSFDMSLKFLTALSISGSLYYFNKLLYYFNNCLSNSFWYLILLIPVSWNYMFINSIYHAYDIPTLFFFCVSLYLFLNKNFFLFYFIFIISTLNRESNCFITVSIALLLFKFNYKCNFKENYLRNSVLIRHLVAQLTIWFIVVLLINWSVKDSSGRSYEVTYSMRVFIANMWNGDPSWPFLNTKTFLGNPRCFLTLFACSWALIPLLWKYIPTKCKRLLLLIPIYMVPAILYANLMETRVYHELNVVLALALTSGLIRFNYTRVNFSA